MKRLTPAWLALVFVTSAWAQAPSRNPPTKPPAEECSVSGMVVKLAGSEPLKTATVQLQNLEDRLQSHSTVTDVGGRFQLKGINAGRYQLSVSRNGFVTQAYGQRKPGDPGAILTLRPGQNLNDLLFRLIPSAVIAGRVINEEGDPLPWVQVSALREVYSHGKKGLDSETTVPTNDLGEYRLFDLRPGRYFIRADYKPNERVIGRGEIERTGSADQRGYVPMYYPGSPDPARAVALTVKAGEEIPSVEIPVRRVPAFVVRGRIYNLVSRRSAISYSVTLAPRESSQWVSLPQRDVLADAPDGSFVIPDVLPGPYTLMAFWAEEGRRYQAVQNIDVGNADLEGASLVIAPGSTLSGHITWEGKPALDADALIIFLREADGSYGYSYRARTSTTGLFTLSDVFDGRYRLAIGGQSKDSYLKAVRYGATEALENAFAVFRGTNAPLEVIVSSRGARIQGTVSDTENLPVAGVWVVLIPDEPHRDQFRL